VRRIAVGRPCCNYRKSYGATRITVYDVANDAVVNEVYPARCWKLRMEGKDPHEEVVLEFDEARHLVFYRYRTNSNRGRIVFYNIPPSLTIEQAVELIRKKWQYREVYAKIAEPATGNIHLYSVYYYRPIQ
jgi:hypothetical protein